MESIHDPASFEEKAPQNIERGILEDKSISPENEKYRRLAADPNERRRLEKLGYEIRVTKDPGGEISQIEIRKDGELVFYENTAASAALELELEKTPFDPPDRSELKGGLYPKEN